MPDPVTPLTREQPMKPLTVEEVTNYRAVALLGSLGGSGNAQGLSSQDYVIRDLCDSHEALRAETEALRQERDERNKLVWITRDELADYQRLTGLLDGLCVDFEAAINLVNAIHEPSGPCGRKGRCVTCTAIEKGRETLARLADGSR